MPGANPQPNDVPAAHLAELQRLLDQEIPMCAQMAMRVVDYASGGLAIAMPLEVNRNHQETAFAGSLNALCTIAGWGTVYLLLRRMESEGAIVIRRSTIKYHRPVSSSQVVARCLPIEPLAEQHFSEMYLEKGQAKIDLSIEIPGEQRAAVSFSGSYVVSRS